MYQVHSKLNLFLRLSVMLAFLLASVHLYAEKIKGKRHNVTPMIGFAMNSTSPFTISPSPNLKIDYVNGDNFRIPLSLRYQYRMRHGHLLGLDVLANYNPLYLKPAYYSKDQNGFVGPSVLNQSGNMLGGDIHYSKVIDIKIIEVFGFVGIGGYFLQPDNRLLGDFNWYKNADPEFYEFAVAASNNSSKKFLPVSTFGFGARFKHLEAGINYQYSLSSPVNSFEYQGVKFNNPIRFRSLGYYVAYRFEF